MNVEMNIEEIKKIWILYYPYKTLKKLLAMTRDNILDYISRFFLIRNISIKKKNSKIRVCFVVQVPNLWDKMEGIYNELIANDLFEVLMLVVPSYNFANGELLDYEKNNYFLAKYKNARKALNEEGKLINIKSLKIDYVFLQRPYDVYLPKGLKSSDLVKISKLCFVPYGYLMSSDYIWANIDKKFFRNVYINFCTSVDVNNTYKKQFSYNIKRGIQKTFLISYPEFDLYKKNQKNKGKRKTILWTPRWTYDLNIGGSHFFEYVDNIVGLKTKFRDIEVIIRPHPLMFDNFLKNGLLTKEQIRKLKILFKKNEIILSENRSLKVDLQIADILITDYSSLIAPFFMTGNPIIYCECSTNNWIRETKEMVKTFYNCSSWDMIQNCVKQLVDGNDYKYGERKRVIKKINSGCGSKEVVDTLINDYNENNDGYEESI